MIKFLDKDKTKNFFLEILFPPVCFYCKKELQKNLNWQNFLCALCAKKIPINNALFCPVCRKRLPNGKNLCRHKDMPNFLLASAANYDNPIVQNLIHYFKYKKIRAFAPFLGKIMVKYIENCGLELEIREYIVIPIPLHFLRQYNRGFNQAELLGKYVAEKFKLRFINCLKRIKNNPKQANLSAEERKKNIHGCFRFKRNFAAAIAGKNILLVDDVCTSGATLTEAAKILKDNGCKKIIALTIAKT